MVTVDEELKMYDNKKIYADGISDALIAVMQLKYCFPATSLHSSKKSHDESPSALMLRRGQFSLKFNLTKNF